MRANPKVRNSNAIPLVRVIEFSSTVIGAVAKTRRPSQRKVQAAHIIRFPETEAKR
jgi:hypothetical protein